jgi:hypothetical protein
MRLAALGLSLALAACAEAPPLALDDPDACGAAALQPLVGQPLARFDPASVAGPLRIYRSGDPVTTDYSPARLNIETDRRGTILWIICG